MITLVAWTAELLKDGAIPTSILGATLGPLSFDTYTLLGRAIGNNLIVLDAEK